MKINRTRERILDKSIELFNRKQASNVSTVQISTALEISPGNLYYYYTNKEEVIRCTWKERMVPEITEILETAEEINDKKDKYIINYFSLMIIKSIREYCMKKYKKGFKKYLSSPSLMTREFILDAINYSYVLFDLSRKIVKLDIPDIAIIIILNDLITSVGDDFLKTIDKCKQEFEKIYKNKEW